MDILTTSSDPTASDENVASTNSPAPRGEHLQVCLAGAKLLLSKVKEEAQALRQFDHHRLLQLLPQKEMLARELHRTFHGLRENLGPLDSDREKPAYLALKQHLDEIVRQNHTNLTFIQGSLAHFQNLMDTIAIQPSNYAPGKQGPTACVKGLTLRKEI